MPQNNQMLQKKKIEKFFLKISSYVKRIPTELILGMDV